MKKTIKFILRKISRVIFWIIPSEFKPKHPSKKKRLQIKLYENLSEETFNNFKEHINKSLFFEDSWEIKKYAIKTALLNNKNKEYYYLEFGVWNGKSANFFSKFVNRLYAFDSFEGLKEDWVGTSAPKGSFNLNKKIPSLNSNIEIVIGWIENTLDDFLEKHNPKINFIHLDMDTYSPTKFTLEKLKPYLVKNSIILFDQLYNYFGWKYGEYKALNEVFKDNEFEYKAFNLEGNQCVIQIK